MGKMAEKETLEKNDEIEWVPKHFFEAYVTESAFQKLKRKSKENPMVPIGLGMTICALSYGLYNFYHGRHALQQHSMRARVTFQGLTLAAICYSMYIEGQNRLKKDQEAREKAKSSKV
ncbi:HIG1 domain family member 2A, mitochondrial [Belonocnema kinseyi]|uniref:HIG1 domain family member 2A, mitochondrial n=1 Tax=Belonocnema kinseyi TaxID=2817044 RepID=UPI00143D8B24|nr:HIG1 domain family member 2A, mitochondrial [Belonocnema kinseyi]